MAPIDWEELMVVNTEDLPEEKAEELFEVLGDFDPGEEDDLGRLKKLFFVTQAVLLAQAAKAEILEEELADMAKQEGKSDAKKDQEVEALKREIQSLKRENKEMKRFGPEGAQSGGREMRFVRDEMNELEHQLNLLQREMREKDKQLTDERTENERLLARAEQAEKDLRETKKECESLHDDLRDYQRQLDAQRESLLSRRDEDADFRDKITAKNRLLNAALEENRLLAEANVDLEKKLADMKKELREGRDEIVKTTEDYLSLKRVVKTSDNVTDGLKRENEMLKDQVAYLQEQVKSKGDSDDAIMVQVDRKVEEWKSILAEKDDRIIDLQGQVMKLRDQLIAANVDSEKASVAALTKAVEERDRRIEVLKKKLDEAVSDMESNVALMEDVRSTMQRGGRDTGDKHIQRISQMTNTIRIHEDHLRDAEARAQDAESDARDKDRQLSEALERMRQYEAGEYGLAEAVAEIKECKVQVNVRDRQIEELTQYINKVELKVNDLYDENESLRDRLGLDPAEPIDLGDYRRKKGLRTQEERALNQVLQKEVERLEEERVQLKLQIRKLATASGMRVSALGIDTEEILSVGLHGEDKTQRKEKQMLASFSHDMKAEVENDRLRVQKLQLDQDLEQYTQKLETLRKDNAELRAKLKETEDQNSDLEKGMKEIHAAIKEQGSDGDVRTIQCPSLERMLAAIDSKNMLGGRYDTTLYLKAQVDNLTGHNEELRQELKESRLEATKAQVELDRKKSKVEVLEEEVKTLREVGAGGNFQAMPLPEGMAVTSSDVIANINEHLIQTLQELSLKEELVVKMETSLDSYRRKFAVMRHQQSLIYQDHIIQQKAWEEERTKIQTDMENMEGMREEDKVRIQEFDRLLDTLGQEDVEVRRRLVDITRKITVLRVNEKALTRRYNAMSDLEGTLRKENSKLKNEMIQMESAVSERLGYLQRYKDMSSFRIAALQKALDDAVPKDELDRANRHFTELTEKYREMLEKFNILVLRNEASVGFETETKRLTAENTELRKELEVEREKLHALEAAFENMRKQGMMSSQELTDHDVTSISKRLTMLEMKELNERQRAEHAVRMYDQQKAQLRQLEDRNFELESKFAEVTKLNLESQKIERVLRDELANCVTKEVSDADRKRIAKLEETDMSLRQENSKLKEISDISTVQARALEAQQVSRDKEVLSLRQQLLDFQSQSDEKTVIGKLHRHIVQLQVSEGTAVRKQEDANKKIYKLQAQLLRAEQHCDDKDQAIYHNRLENRSKTKYLKHTIQEFRRKFSGAVPLQQQERFASSMAKVLEDKKKTEQDLQKANNERQKVEDKLAELKVQHSGLQELIDTIQDGRGAQKVAEWHSKMETLRLEELRHKREIERKKHQIQFMEQVLKKHEAEVLNLEEEKVRQAKEFEERELEWEHREVELERIIHNMERMQAEIAGAANQFEQAVSSLPDPNWPVAKQLEHAISTIKNNVKVIMDAKGEAQVCKKRLDEMAAQVRQLEREITNRDRVITELRLRLPATEDRDKIIAKATATAFGTPKEEDLEGRQAVRVAQSTVQSLQARVTQKEETLQKYQELLSQAREDMRTQNAQHQAELQSLQEKLHSKSDAAFAKFKQAALESVSKPSAPVPTNDQLRRLNELEDVVAEQDNSLSAMRDKLNKARQEIQDWKYKYEDAIRANHEDKEGMLEEHAEAIRNLQDELEEVRQKLSEQEKELDLTEAELKTQKEDNIRAPTVTMKNMVERLKNQLALKEKQQKALSKALTELRADMVTNAQDQVMANMEQTAVEHNIQKVVEKKTKELQDQIEELTTQNQKMKRDLKRLREKDSNLSAELDETKHDLAKKEGIMRKLKEDRARMEGEVEELERKVERMSTMSKQRGGLPSEQGSLEIDELRRKNRLLQEELTRAKHQPEKPYVEQQPPKESRDGQSRDEALVRWEESKKWQKMVDRLKGRIKEKDQEIEKLSKSNELFKNGIERANRDKESLESKLRMATKGGASGVVPTDEKQTSAKPDSSASHNIEPLRRKNYELEEEVAKLKRQLTKSHDTAFEEVQLRNKFLSDKLKQLEQEMARRLTASQELNGEGVVSQAAYRELSEKEHELQKQVLKLSEENIELKFEVEQARKDIPRLKERIEDLQKYVDILKTEKTDLQHLSSARSIGSISLSSLGSGGSNIKRIGESGKSQRELEKTIALLKKVIERTQAENEALKRTPGVVSTEQVQAVQRENQALKSQLEELRQKMGSTLSERYTSQQKGTAKVLADHDKLRRDLMKEMESNEKLRIKITQHDLTNQQLHKDLEEVRQRLEVAETHGGPGTSGSMDGGKGWKSAVVTRMYEGKLRALEADLDKKNQTLNDVKVLLREAAERERQMAHENSEKQKKISILERFPPGREVGDSDLMKEYQLSRLTIDRLENEKKELLNELKLMRQAANLKAGGPDDMGDDELLERLKSHDQLIEENVDLRTQLKAAEMDGSKHRMEAERMKKELANFGPDFFEEIEDLKFNYREAVQRNVQYEEQLQQLSQQFGISINIPGL